jgi:hypothetical protein
VDGQLIERQLIVIPNEEKLIAQLTSRRKLYDSKGREKLESKVDLANRGVESPDRADALIGAVMMGIGGDSYALNPGARQADLAMMQAALHQMEASGSPFHDAMPEKNFGDLLSEGLKVQEWWNSRNTAAFPPIRHSIRRYHC